MPLRQGVQYKKVIEGPWEIKPPKIKRGYRYAAVLLGCGHATLVIINKVGVKPVKGPCLLCTEAAAQSKDSKEKRYTQRDLDRLVERKVQAALGRLTGPVVIRNEGAPMPKIDLDGPREIKAVPE